MDIKLTDSLLREYLKTSAAPEVIAEKISLCGPTVDLLEKIQDDFVYHIEVITNRVDAASAFGIARETNAILPQFDIDTKLLHNPYDLNLSDLGQLPTNQPVTVDLVDTSLIPRFTCIALSNVTVKPSPKNIQNLLALHGERSLNNVIDVSNELTLKYGQPVHIFDLDRIKDQTMILRASHPGEEIATLDGRTHKLKGDDIVIEDGAGRLIDLCGIMGGDLSTVTDQTKNILLFVQTYEPKHIRRTSLYTQERTLAAQLFEKQPDPELVLPVLIEGVRLLQERANAQISSALLDIYPGKRPAKSITLDLGWLKQFAGVDIPKKQVLDILHRLGFDTNMITANQLNCQIPSWRLHDISIKEDLAEEITRVYGYFRLPSILPVTGIPAIGTDPRLDLEMKTRHLMAKLGFTEVYNNSLISQPAFKSTPINPDKAFKLANPLSEDYVYMRPSLIPSLEQNIENNRGLATPQLIFELSNIYRKKPGEQLAHEQASLGLAAVDVTFREFKGYFEAIGEFLHVPIDLQSKEIILKHTGNTWIAEINFEKISQQASLIHHFHPIPQFAPIIEDLTFTIPEKTSIGPVMKTIKSIDPLVYQVALKDVYHRNFTFTLTYQSLERPLSTDDIAPIRKSIVETLAGKQIQLVGQLNT